MSDLFKEFEGTLDPAGPEAEILQQIDPEKLPRHIAVIMDGNGRWAAQRHLPRAAGHRAGIDSVREVVETAARLHIPVLTLYAFSAENWKRPQDEVSTLMDLLREYVQRELETILSNNIRFQTIGRIDELPEAVIRDLRNAEEKSSNNSGTRMVVALNYSGRLELVDAFNRILGKGTPRPIDEGDIDSALYTVGLPEPDLLIRTSGEMRVSNFLLWQIAYAEIHVTEVLWPDFRSQHLLRAVLEFQHRERRYGGIRSAAFQKTP